MNSLVTPTEIAERMAMEIELEEDETLGHQTETEKEEDDIANEIRKQMEL